MNKIVLESMTSHKLHISYLPLHEMNFEYKYTYIYIYVLWPFKSVALGFLFILLVTSICTIFFYIFFTLHFCRFCYIDLTQRMAVIRLYKQHSMMIIYKKRARWLEYENVNFSISSTSVHFNEKLELV